MPPMQVKPQFLVRVIPDTLVHLVKSLKGTTHCVVLRLKRSVIQIHPLALFKELKNVSSGPHALGQPGACISY